VVEDTKNREIIARQRLGSAFSNLGNRYAGSVSKDDGKSTNNIENKIVSKVEEDLYSIGKLRGLYSEMSRISEDLKRGFHLNTYVDSLEEFNGLRSCLRKSIENIRSHLEETKIIKEKLLEDIKIASNIKPTMLIQKQIGVMRNVLLGISRQNKSETFEGIADNIDLSALRIALRKEEQIMVGKARQ